MVTQEGTHLVSRVRGGLGKRGRVQVGAPDPNLTGNGGMVAVSELGFDPLPAGLNRHSSCPPGSVVVSPSDVHQALQ